MGRIQARCKPSPPAGADAPWVEYQQGPGPGEEQELVCEELSGACWENWDGLDDWKIALEDCAWREWIEKYTEEKSDI